MLKSLWGVLSGFSMVMGGILVVSVRSAFRGLLCLLPKCLGGVFINTIMPLLILQFKRLKNNSTNKWNLIIISD